MRNRRHDEAYSALNRRQRSDYNDTDHRQRDASITAGQVTRIVSMQCGPIDEILRVSRFRRVVHDHTALKRLRVMATGPVAPHEADV